MVRLRRPQNADVLEQSVFLNALLKRKGISWTKIFADLEKVVPYNVRIIQIRRFGTQLPVNLSEHRATQTCPATGQVDQPQR